MRTTVTLDPDVERLLRDRMKRQGVSFKEALNELIRSGANGKARPAHRFVQKTFSLGSEQNFRWDKALAIDAAIEDEELGRKLSLRK